MHWIIGVSDASSISIGRMLAPMMWFGLVTYGTAASVRYYPSTALVLLWSSVSCRHRSRVKTTPELSEPAFGVLPKIGDEELEERSPVVVANRDHFPTLFRAFRGRKLLICRWNFYAVCYGFRDISISGFVGFFQLSAVGC